MLSIIPHINASINGSSDDLIELLAGLEIWANYVIGTGAT
jgi:hypothetical protein